MPMVVSQTPSFPFWFLVIAQLALVVGPTLQLAADPLFTTTSTIELGRTEMGAWRKLHRGSNCPLHLRI